MDRREVRVGGERYPALDALRVVAMLDVVSIHVTGAYLLRGLGLPVFIVAAVALGVRRAELPRVGGRDGVAGKRARRVLGPWLFWSGFGVVNLVAWALTSEEAALWGERGVFLPWMLVSGPSVHLWFLPFVFVAEVVAVGAVRGLRRWKVSDGVLIAGGLGVAVGGVWVTGAVYDAVGGRFMRMSMYGGDYAERSAVWGWTVVKSWLFGVASVGCGVALGRALAWEARRGGSWGWVSPRRGVLGVALLAVGVYGVSAWVGGVTGIPGIPGVSGQVGWQWWRAFGALVLVAAAVQVAGRTPGWLVGVSGWTLGIYVLHGWVNVRVVPALDRWVPWFAEVSTRPGGRVLVVWVLTAALVAALRRTPVRRAL